MLHKKIALILLLLVCVGYEAEAMSVDAEAKSVTIDWAQQFKVTLIDPYTGENKSDIATLWLQIGTDKPVLACCVEGEESSDFIRVVYVVPVSGKEFNPEKRKPEVIVLPPEMFFYQGTLVTESLEYPALYENKPYLGRDGDQKIFRPYKHKATMLFGMNASSQWIKLDRSEAAPK